MININVVLLPMDDSHIQEFLYKIKGNSFSQDWAKGSLPRLTIKVLGVRNAILGFLPPALTNYNDHRQIKVNECKIVRKNVRRKKSKPA